MSRLAEPTLDREWLNEQTDRLLAFEMLRHALEARYQPVEPALLGDKIALDKGACHRITQAIQCRLTNPKL
jgi:hypothetical protein